MPIAIYLFCLLPNESSDTTTVEQRNHQASNHNIQTEFKGIFIDYWVLVIDYSSVPHWSRSCTEVRVLPFHFCVATKLILADLLSFRLGRLCSHLYRIPPIDGYYPLPFQREALESPNSKLQYPNEMQMHFV